MPLEQDIQHIIDHKTKPLGALGYLETLAAQICRIQQTTSPEIIKPSVVVIAADHGLAKRGVSAYPPEVTAQMVLNFATGGAAINVFSRQHEINLEVVDAGVASEFDPSLEITHAKIAYGTGDPIEDCAITVEQLEACKALARQLVQKHRDRGCNTLGFGEMGIGNTSSAALILSYITGTKLEDSVGRGTGLDDTGLQNKLTVLEQVMQAHPNVRGSDEILRAVGGFEIAVMCEAMIAASEARMIVLVDGFIATAAAMLAVQSQPSLRDFLVFCHQSDEAGHKLMLEHLQATPLLNLNMRLGEGSACALVFPLIQSAVRFMKEMASFESANVANKVS
jgi:nicotinate-nucleotide--dimethylbenzimidazole phosphoribosyltransferase